MPLIMRVLMISSTMFPFKCHSRLLEAPSSTPDDQRWQQSIGLVRKAFLLTLTVSNGELWATEISELPHWEGPSVEENIRLIYIFLTYLAQHVVPYQSSHELGLDHSSGRHRTHCGHARDHPFLHHHRRHSQASRTFSPRAFLSGVRVLLAALKTRLRSRRHFLQLSSRLWHCLTVCATPISFHTIV